MHFANILQITKLKSAIDEETQNHVKLVREEQSFENAEAKAKAAFQLGKSEEKLHALTILMLHCCAGLQDSHDTLSTITITRSPTTSE